ncbi:hypothetical protein K2X05_03505 [bacterium]|nr:hypothetical protein [bacterium]
MMAPTMLIIFKTLLFWSLCSHAEFNLATGLTQSNRIEVLKILGLGSSSKNISTLRPLGTDSGLEVAISFEFINTHSINQYIADEQSKNSLNYPKIIIGKGIYEKTDLFFHFIPYTATFGISEFGSLLRFNFYKSSRFVFTGLVHANSANFNNQLVSRNLGGDLMIGIEQGALSVFTTLGWAVASGKFIGGTQGVTDSLTRETEEVHSLHAAVGSTYRWSDYSLTLSMDHYAAPVYTVKLSAIF